MNLALEEIVSFFMYNQEFGSYEFGFKSNCFIFVQKTPQENDFVNATVQLGPTFYTKSADIQFMWQCIIEDRY